MLLPAVAASHRPPEPAQSMNRTHIMSTLPLLAPAGHPDPGLPPNWYTLDVILADDFPRV